jgi:hypothetical protein
VGLATCCAGVRVAIASYLVGLVRSGGSDLALLSRRKLGKVTVVVALPMELLALLAQVMSDNAHLVVEDLGLARLGLGDKRVVEDVENILADLLELGLDLLSVVADGANVLLGALGLLLLLDRGDDAPGRASCTDNVLVGDGEEVALVDGQLTANLYCISSYRSDCMWSQAPARIARSGGRHTLATSCRIVSM